MKQSTIIALLFCCLFSAFSSDAFIYRLILKDKGNPPFSVEQPEMFLSQKSIQRRIKQGLAVDSADLPIDSAYLNAIAGTGAVIRAYGKWTKTVAVLISDTLVPTLEVLPFIDTLYCVWKGALPQQPVLQEQQQVLQNADADDPNPYGDGFTQIALNNGHLLHEAGFRGKGVTIAVLDGGFIHANTIEYLDAQRIKGVKVFSHESINPLLEGADHGTKVLSCMLADKPDELTGTAPEADYYLLMSEIDREEYPVEEDYWVAALEYADSIGADIVTSSVGYTTFDDSSMNHTRRQLDGKTVPMSIAAGMAASRGMLVLNSAGNEGGKAWEKIMFPGDAFNILTVGAVDKDSVHAHFSSAGFTADGRVKPDLAALGKNVTTVNGNGQIKYGDSGTSFATPILAGLVACLRQALPELAALEIIELLKETAGAFAKPDSLTGYGIADVYKAYMQRKSGLRLAGKDAASPSVNVYGNSLHVHFGHLRNYPLALHIYSAMGVKLLSVPQVSSPVDISFLPKGIYIAGLQTGGKPVFVRKFIKM